MQKCGCISSDTEISFSVSLAFQPVSADRCNTVLSQSKCDVVMGSGGVDLSQETRNLHLWLQRSPRHWDGCGWRGRSCGRLNSALCLRPPRLPCVQGCSSSAPGGRPQRELPCALCPKHTLPWFPNTHHSWASDLLSKVGVNEEGQPLRYVGMTDE